MGSWKLKPVLAIAASFGTMAVVGQAAADEALTWSKGAVPANAVIAGGSKEKPMHICRLPMPDKSLHPGKAMNGNCYVGFGGKEIKAPLKDAEVLGSSAPAGWADVKGGKVPAGALKAGVAGGVTMHFCRAKHEGKEVHAGKEYKGNCYYGYGGKEIKTAEFQVMGLIKVAAAPGAPQPAAAPVKPTAPVAAPPVPAKPGLPPAPDCTKAQAKAACEAVAAKHNACAEKSSDMAKFTACMRAAPATTAPPAPATPARTAQFIPPTPPDCNSSNIRILVAKDPSKAGVCEAQNKAHAKCRPLVGTKINNMADYSKCLSQNYVAPLTADKK